MADKEQEGHSLQEDIVLEQKQAIEAGEGYVQNAESQFVVKPNLTGQEESLAKTIIRFIPSPEYAYSFSRMPVDVGLAYSHAIGQMMFFLTGVNDVKQDAATIMGIYHARDGYMIEKATQMVTMAPPDLEGRKWYHKIPGVGPKANG